MASLFLRFFLQVLVLFFCLTRKWIFNQAFSIPERFLDIIYQEDTSWHGPTIVPPTPTITSSLYIIIDIIITLLPIWRLWLTLEYHCLGLRNFNPTSTRWMFSPRNQNAIHRFSDKYPFSILLNKRFVTSALLGNVWDHPLKCGIAVSHIWRNTMSPNYRPTATGILSHS